MASAQEFVTVPEVFLCYHCGSECTDSCFKYFDNKKLDQPRYQCHHCLKFFTFGWHGRTQGKTYAKKRNEDPVELKSLSRQCRHCGVADHAVFKYYNNKNLSQPRFKCLSCGEQFQMRLLGTGEERRLVHTSAQQTRAPRRRKQGMLEPLPNASSSFEDGSSQASDGSFMSTPSYPLKPFEFGTGLLPEMSDEDVQFEDVQFVNFIESELAEEENTEAQAELTEARTEEEDTEADLLPWTANGDNENVPLPSSDEDLDFLQFLRTELLTEEAPNVDAFPSMTNVDAELPPTWSNEDAQLTDFMEADDVMAPDVSIVSDQMAEMVSKSTCSNVEVMYGTLEVDRPAASDFDSWSDNETSEEQQSYADAAAACCYQMDLDMARENSMLAVVH